MFEWFNACTYDVDCILYIQEEARVASHMIILKCLSWARGAFCDALYLTLSCYLSKQSYQLKDWLFSRWFYALAGLHGTELNTIWRLAYTQNNFYIFFQLRLTGEADEVWSPGLLFPGWCKRKWPLLAISCCKVGGFSVAYLLEKTT